MPTIAVTIVDQTVAVTQVGEIGPTGATGATGTVSAAGDGTAGAPGIAFASDTNTGLFRPGTDILAVATGGVERLRIDASGRVGFGVVPSYRLDLSASGAVAAHLGGILIGANGTDIVSDTGILSLQASGANYMGFNTNSLERVRITSAGNVGIGTVTPSAALEVNGNLIIGKTNSGQSIYVGNGDNTNQQRLLLSMSGTDAVIDATRNSGTGPNMLFMTDSSEKMRLSHGGNVTPGADNTQNVGSGSLRWATIYAGTGTINTSDERYKVLREGGDLTDAEFAAWSNVRAIVYQDKDSFERKGNAARLHIGYSWQSIQAAFEAEGLDAGRYGLWCEDALEAPVEKIRMVSRPVEGQTETIPVLDDDGEPVFEQVQETEEVEQAFEEVRMIDGAPVLVKGVRTVAQPVFDSVQIRDEDGELLFDTPQPIEDPETGELVEGDPVPRMAPVPRMISKAKTETVPVMEEVEEAFTEMEPTGETRGALRYNQCSVIEAAWLRRELASVAARLSVLEAL